MLKTRYRYFEGKHVANRIVAGLPLTSCEISVLSSYAKDRTPKETANALGISVKTVHWHKSNILVKLGKRTVIGAVIHAAENHMI